MPYDIRADLEDCDTFYPGLLYLPGEHVEDLDSPRYRDAMPDCVYCGESISWRGTRNANFSLVAQVPAAGDHDGLITSCYAPFAGAGMSCTDYGHLRCALDSAAMGSVVITIATPEVTGDISTGRHAAA